MNAPTPPQHGAPSGGAGTGGSAGDWRDEWRGLFDVLNLMAVDIVGAITTGAFYDAADWVSARIEAIRSLAWHPTPDFTLTVHDLFRVSAFIIISAFAARSVSKLVRRILR